MGLWTDRLQIEIDRGDVRRDWQELVKQPLSSHNLLMKIEILCLEAAHFEIEVQNMVAREDWRARNLKRESSYRARLNGNDCGQNDKHPKPAQPVGWRC